MVDYTKRELNKLMKAYNNLYGVLNGYYSQNIKEFNTPTIKNMLNHLENIFIKNGYEIVAKQNTYTLKRAKK